MNISTAEKLYNQVEIVYNLLVMPMPPHNQVADFTPEQAENFREVDTTLELLDIVRTRIVNNIDSDLVLDIVHNTILHIQRSVDFYQLTKDPVLRSSYNYRTHVMLTKFGVNSTRFANIHSIFHALAYSSHNTILYHVLPDIIKFI